MKKFMPFCFILTLFLFTIISGVDVSGQAPPPPAHSLGGNQASPGGTGCPIDRTDGIVFALIVSLAYAGFAVYKRSKKNREIL